MLTPGQQSPYVSPIAHAGTCLFYTVAAHRYVHEGYDTCLNQSGGGRGILELENGLSMSEPRLSFKQSENTECNGRFRREAIA